MPIDGHLTRPAAGISVLLMSQCPARDAHEILAEIGPDMTALPSAQAFAAWAGVATGNNECAGKWRTATIRRGLQYLRSLLIELAHGASCMTLFITLGVDLSTGGWCRGICGKLSEFDTVSGVVMHSGEASVPL
ncbi:MAG: transposase, partial [Alphaproteobacteria bacterium]|nr:transposase [Alphaproteobacteria bacterium]